MKGMDHGWVGAPTTGAGAWLTAPLQDDNLGHGGGDQYEDAAELMWQFFKKYRRGAAVAAPRAERTA